MCPLKFNNVQNGCLTMRKMSRTPSYKKGVRRSSRPALTFIIQHEYSPWWLELQCVTASLNKSALYLLFMFAWEENISPLNRTYNRSFAAFWNERVQQGTRRDCVYGFVRPISLCVMEKQLHSSLFQLKQNSHFASFKILICSFKNSDFAPLDIIIPSFLRTIQNHNFSFSR